MLRPFRRSIASGKRASNRILLTITTIASMAVSACSSEGSNGTYQPSRSVEGITFRWSAEPGISLVDGPAVAVRAYLESYDRAFFAQADGVTYGGFDRAVAPNVGDFHSPTGLRRPYTKLFEMEAPRTLGTERIHIQRMTQSGDRTEAIVCSDVRRLSQIFDHDWRGPSYRSISSFGLLTLYDNPGLGLPVRMSVSVMRVALRGAPDPNQTVQRGDSSFPRGDVFGNWSIDEFSWYGGQYSVQVGKASVLSPVPWASADADLEACKRFVQPLAAPPTDGKNALFATEPSYPGWPQ